MSIITSSKARIAALAAVALATGSLGTLLLSPPAEALPTPQRSCADDRRTMEGAGDWSPVMSAVTINNGKVARKVVVNLNVDAYVSSESQIDIGWKVDKGPIKMIGAHTLANASPHTQVRHIMVVLDIPAGKHRIQPFWSVMGFRSDFGAIEGRCLTAEAYTS
jgi:hypothetical protein